MNFRRTRFLRGIVVLILGAGFCGVEVVIAQQISPLPQTSPGTSPQSVTNTPPPTNGITHYVVLTNGGLYAGKLELVGEQFKITRPSGASLRLTSSEIDFIAGSFEEAYTKLKSRLRSTDINGHNNLANWCLRHRNLEFARLQIDYLQSISIDDRRISSLRKQLASMTARNKATGNNSSGSSDPSKAPSRPPNGMASNQQLQLLINSLPKESLRRFVSDVHPRLMSGCATANCHSGKQSGLRLWRGPTVGGVKSRVIQRNLYGAMHFVNRQYASRSPLLSYASTAHGDQEQAAYEKGSVHYQLFKEWITSTDGGSGIVYRDSQVRPTSFVEDSNQTHSSNAPSPVNLLRKPTVSAASDPFDPEIFNRKFHPAKTSSIKPADPKLETHSPLKPRTTTGKKTRSLPPIDK